MIIFSHVILRVLFDFFFPLSTGVKQNRKFENAMTIDKYSWGYRRNARLEDFLTMDELIHTFIITVR